jgi:hypothetical protein
MNHPLPMVHGAKFVFDHRSGFPAVQPQDAGTTNGLDVVASPQNVQDTPERYAEFVGNHTGGS